MMVPSGLVIVNVAVAPSVPFAFASMQSTSVPIAAPALFFCFDVMQNMARRPSRSTDQLNTVVPRYCPATWQPILPATPSSWTPTASSPTQCAICSAN